MPRVVISSSSHSDSTETEESSDFEAYSPPAEESSTIFGGFVHQLFADPLGFPSHLPASPDLDSPSLSPLARGPGEFEDVEFFPSQPSILKESNVSLVRLLLGPSVELSPNSFRFVETCLSLCDSLSIPQTLSLFTQLFYVAAVGSRSPGSIQIVPREGLRFEGIIKSFKRWKERFVFVRPVGGAFDFPTSWPTYYFKLDRPPAPTGVLAQQVQAFRDLGQVQVNACIELEALEKAGLLPSGAVDAGASGSGVSFYDAGPGDKGKKPVDEPSAPPAFGSSPSCALADSGALRKRARAEPAEEELSGSLPQPLTLAVTGWTDSSMCGTRFNYEPLEWGEKAVAAVSANHKCSRERSQELEELDACFKDLTVRYQDQVEASHRSLTTQAELRRAFREAEERRRVAEESLFSAVSDYQNSDKFHQDVLASIRGASDDFALIGKDWLASPEGAQYAAGMSLEDYYEGSRHTQQEIYATLRSSNPPFMPTDLGLPPPLLGLIVLADLSNTEISLGPLDSVDGAGSQDVRGDVSSQAPGV
nr:MAP7 domain-containing protein 1-like [Ipomoea batatas]